MWAKSCEQSARFGKISGPHDMKRLKPAEVLLNSRLLTSLGSNSHQELRLSEAWTSMPFCCHFCTEHARIYVEYDG